MPIQRIPGEVIVQRGEELFEQKVQTLVADHPAMDFVAIDVESSDFEVGPNRREIMNRLLARHPEAQTYTRRVGFPYTYRLGGGRRIPSIPEPSIRPDKPRK
jgi:hypothetical protein